MDLTIMGNWNFSSPRLLGWNVTWDHCGDDGGKKGLKGSLALHMSDKMVGMKKSLMFEILQFDLNLLFSH